MAGSGLLYFDVGGGGNRVSVVNSDGTNQTQLVGSTATLQEPQDIGLDTAAGFYFGISNKSGAGDVAHLVRGSLSGGDVVVVADYGVGSDANNSAGDDNLVNALQVDPLNHKIYVGIQEPTGTKPANSGIRQYSYDPATGAVTDQGWLVQLSASTKPKEGSLYLFGPTDFSLDSGTGKLFISEVFSGTAKAQGIFSLNLSSPNTVTQVVAQSQFPDSLSGATVHDVVADTSTQLLYFTSSAKGGSYGQGNYVPANVGQNAIWYVPETGNGATAVKVALTPPDGSHFYPLSLTIDQSTRQLYVESVENAGLNTTSDVIEVYQLDAAGTGATYLRTIQPTNHSTQGNQTRGLAFNAAPVLTGAGSSTATESAGTNSTAAAAAGSVTVSDDEGQIKSATVSITGGFLTGTGHQDSLSFTNQNGITGSYNSGTGVLTLTGTATAASYQTALNSVQFIDSGDNPTAYGTNTTRTISFTVNDGVLASGTATSTVTVVGTNDAPAITGTRGTVDPQTEDTPFTISKATFFAGITDPDDQSGNTSPGLSIVSITNGTTTDTSPGGNSGGITFTPTADYNGSYTINYRVTDPHGGSVDASFTTSLRAVADIVADSAVTNANVPVNIYVQANDTFENAAHNIAGVTTPAHGSVSINDNGTPGNAADDYLVYTPAAGYSGSDSFSYSIGSGGVFESANVAVTVNFVPNHAPTGTNKTITTNEDTAYTLAASDFGFGDAGDTPANALVSVTVGTVSGGGALTLGGQAVTAGETIGAADIAAGSLVFTPDHDANGAGYAGFTFQVRDDGGTAGGGADTDPTPRTLTFDVTPVNDAPVIGAATQAALTYTISGQPVALLQGVTISDPDLPASFVNGQLVIASDVSDEGDAITLAAGSHFAVADNGYGNGTLTLSLVDGATSTEIGTVGGYGTDTVAIGYLTADATAAVLTDLAQSFVFTTAHVGDDATRHIGVQVGDGTLSGDDLGFAVAGPQTLTVQAPPAAPADLTLLNDTGASASDDLTRATKPVVGGTGVLGETITLYGDGQVLGTTTVGGDGTWSVASGTALGDGSHELAATATSAAGVTGPASSPLAIVIDTVAPATPAGIMVSADGVPINSPAAVNASSLTISGTAEADGVVTFYVNSVATATAVVDHGGHWSRTFDATTLSGVQRFAETVTDAAGNASVVTPSFKVQVTHLSGGTGDDTLTAPDSSKWYLFGGEGDDALTGNIGADTLNGGSGADHMAGGAGNDIYYVDDAGDTVVEASGQGNDKVYASVDYNAAGTSVENIFARSETGVHLTASDNATYILGGSGDDVLTGGQGNDRLSGGAGADHMAGGNGNDIYFVDDAGDVVTEAAGAGNDKVYATADYNAAGSSVETIVGRGTAGLVLTGGISAASIFGGDGNDVLTGGLLTDALGGGAGDDRLVATAGHDKLSGGAGADTFVLSAHASGSDSPQILDFLGGTDHIELSAADFHGALAGNTLDPDAFRVNTTGKAEDADDRFIYNSTNGGLYYDDDGIGADHRVFVAQLIHAPTLTAHDFTFG